MLFVEISKDTEVPFEKKKLFITGGLDRTDLWDPIARSIVNVYDCSCIIDIRPESSLTDAEGWDTRLEQFDLIVFAVTKDFLTSGCPARVYFFRYAVEHRIPILPVLCEEGLESMFSRVCGHYHMINALRDTFSQELVDFIESRIDIYYPITPTADPFAAKGFVSYRKSDRAQLMQVMRAFQQLPACLNCELWFDDFLIKGEDYDEGIDESLQNSDFMLLTATPRLFEPAAGGGANYVERTEYPNAIRYGKPVLAVEAEPIDRAEFARRFPQAYLVSLSRPDELAAAVSGLFGSPADRLPQLDPEQLCELGNCYMTGRKVCRNPGLAIELYKAAAENGCEQGSFRLAKFYGDSERPEDMNLALHYFEVYSSDMAKKINGLYQGLNMQNEWQRNYFIDLCSCDANSLLDFSELALKTVRDPQQLRKILSANRLDYAEICKMLYSLRIPPSEKINLGNAELMLMPVMLEDGFFDDAFKMLAEAEKHFELAFRGRRTEFTQTQYARLFYSRGIIYSKAGRHHDAAEDLDEALELCLSVPDRNLPLAWKAADALFLTAKRIEEDENDRDKAQEIYYKLCRQYRALGKYFN